MIIQTRFKQRCASGRASGQEVTIYGSGTEQNAIIIFYYYKSESI